MIAARTPDCESRPIVQKRLIVLRRCQAFPSHVAFDLSQVKRKRFVQQKSDNVLCDRVSRNTP